MTLFISIDQKYKTDTVIAEQIKTAKEESEKAVGEILSVVDSVEKADCVWFVDEWEDDIDCYKEYEYCVKNGIRILHDRSEFWNRVLT